MNKKIELSLKFLEKYTKTDMLYLVKGGFWLSLGYIISMFISLGLTVAFANLMKPEAYGVYKFIISSMGIIGAFSLTGFANAITRATSRGFQGSLIQGFRAQIKWSIVPITLGFLAATYYFINGNKTIAIGLILAGTIFPIIQSFSLYNGSLLGRKKFKRQTIFYILQQIIQAILLIIALFITNNIIILIIIYLSTLLITSIIFYIIAKSEIDKTTSDTELISDGKHLTVLKGIATLASEIDKISIFHYLGAVNLAIYSFATIPVLKISSLTAVIKNISLPKLSTINLVDLKKTLPRKIGILMLASCFVVLLYILTAPFIFKLVFPLYVQSVTMTQVFSLIIVFTIPATLMNQVLVAHMKKKSLYIAQIIPPVIRILLICLLVPRFGMWGAIFSILGSNIINFLILSIIFYKLK